MLLKVLFPLLTAVILSYSSAELWVVPGRAEVDAGRWYLADDGTLAAKADHQLAEGPTQNIPAAKNIRQDLLVRDAASAERWCDFGMVLALVGQVDKGAYCVRWAAQLAPNSPQVLFSIGGFYSSIHQFREAVPYFAKILSTVPVDSRVYGYLDEMRLDFDELVAYGGLPAEKLPAQSYFLHLLTRGDAGEAKKAWTWITAHSLSDDKLANEYVNFLLAKGLTEDAATAWTLQARGREPGYGNGTFVFNGDFEHNPVGSPFDWQITQLEHVQATRDGQAAHLGSWSLRLLFDGKENVNYQGVSQHVFLQPGTYRFQAFIRTAGITTDQGVALRVFDAEEPNRLSIETEGVTGTTEWKKLEKSLVVRNPTRLVEIQVIRHSSLKFDSLIGGTAWIDDVSLTRVQ